MDSGKEVFPKSCFDFFLSMAGGRGWGSDLTAKSNLVTRSFTTFFLFFFSLLNNQTQIERPAPSVMFLKDPGDLSLKKNCFKD